MKRASVFLLSLMGAMTLRADEPLVVPDFVQFLSEIKTLDGPCKEAAEQGKGITILLMTPGST